MKKQTKKTIQDFENQDALNLNDSEKQKVKGGIIIIEDHIL